MPLQYPSQSLSSPDLIWSGILSQLERSSQPPPPRPSRRRTGETQRFAVRVVTRLPNWVRVEEADDPLVFDAMSCLLMTCRQVGWDVTMQPQADARPLLLLTTAQSAASVQRQLAPVLAQCNASLREGPWKIIATNRHVH